jgi:hypothetical protein
VWIAFSSDQHQQQTCDRAGSCWWDQVPSLHCREAQSFAGRLIYLCKYLLIIVRTNGTLQYHCYRATNATDARIGCVPTVPTPVYRCVGQFANTVKYSLPNFWTRIIPPKPASEQSDLFNRHYRAVPIHRYPFQLLKWPSSGTAIRCRGGHDFLHPASATEAARASRKKSTQRRVIGGGIISVAEARTRIKDRADEETTTEARRAKKR